MRLCDAAGSALLLLSVASSASSWPKCRCLPADPCWSKVDWSALNASVHGRLEASVDVMEPCVDDLDGEICSQALEGSDDEFWLTARPNGYQHTGLFGVWNLTGRISSFAVRAETEADIQATVSFAAANDLRLVVKATGHDWYGRSTAGGSVLLWTHLRKNITWHDSFVPAGSTEAGVPAVTVQSGVQFSDLYPAAQSTPYPGDPLGRRTIVMGGGCDSVGVGGCWLGGCYNVFTKKFGDGAVNLLEAKVVLANGSFVTANKASHPEVFWTLRGGGGGNIAVVTEFTARTHPAPRYTSSSGFYGTARDLAGFKVLLKRVLKGLAETNQWPLEQQCASGSPGWDVAQFTATLGCRHWEGDPNKTAALYQPMLDWCKLPAQQQLGLKCSAHASITWKQSEYRPHSKLWDNASFIPTEWVGNEPWISYHADREISTALVGSLSKYIPMRGCTDDGLAGEIVDGIIKIEAILQNMSNPAGGIHVLDGPTGDKSQSGMPPGAFSQPYGGILTVILLINDVLCCWSRGRRKVQRNRPQPGAVGGAGYVADHAEYTFATAAPAFQQAAEIPLAAAATIRGALPCGPAVVGMRGRRRRGRSQSQGVHGWLERSPACAHRTGI